MIWRIKNWAKFQHFKDRRPPWVKLYRDLLDDMEWHQLEPRAAKALVMLWLIASENDGQLPEAKALAFRLRTSVDDVEAIIGELSHWLCQGDIAPISGGDQDDTPETETETETEKRQRLRASFEQFWAAYPKKDGKAKAADAFAKVTEPTGTLIAAVKRHCLREDWRKDGGRYIPLPATWLNQKRWEDQGTEAPAPRPTGPDPALEKIKRDSELAAPPSLETLAKLAALRKPKEPA